MVWTSCGAAKLRQYGASDVNFPDNCAFNNVTLTNTGYISLRGATNTQINNLVVEGEVREIVKLSEFTSSDPIEVSNTVYITNISGIPAGMFIGDGTQVRSTLFVDGVEQTLPWVAP